MEVCGFMIVVCLDLSLNSFEADVLGVESAKPVGLPIAKGHGPGGRRFFNRRKRREQRRNRRFAIGEERVSASCAVMNLVFMREIMKDPLRHPTS